MARVVMVGNFGLTTKGTMRARALPLARALARRDHEVTVLLPATDDPSSNFDDQGVRVRYARGLAIRGARELSIALALVREARDWRPDVVHAFKPISYAGIVLATFVAGAALGAGRPRLVVDADDWEGTGGWATFDKRPFWLRRLIDFQERWTLRHGSVTVASRHLLAMISGLDVPPSRIHYLPNGADAPPLRRDEAARAAIRGSLGLDEAKVVLLYTRFFEYPVARAAAVFERVAAAVPEARLLVVGKGFRSEERELAAVLAQRGLDRKAVFAGWVAFEALGSYFAAADLGIYPLSDTLLNRTKCPAKLVELMANGVPVVAEAVGQANEYVVAGESGFLVPSGDEEAFGEIVSRLLRNDDLRAKIGAGAIARIRSGFLWDQLAEVAEAAYGLRARSLTRPGEAYV